MTHSTRWQDHRRIVLLVGLFAVCCLSALVVRAAVSAERVSDLVAVILQIGTFLAFVVTSGLVLWAAIRPRTRTERVALRALPLGVALTAIAFAETSYGDVSVALHALGRHADKGNETTIVVGPTGGDIRLSGDITEGAAGRLDTLLDAHPEIGRIHLTSDGGLADEGEALRHVIAAHKLTTFVPDYCVSACTLAFLGGRERLIMADARVGFHSPYEEGLFDQTFAGDSTAERAAYISAGVAPDFVDTALKVAPADIWTPDADRLISAHVATGVADRYRFPDSTLDGTPDIAGARAAVLRSFPLAKALAGWKPETLDRLADWYVAAYRQGRSEGEVADQLTSIIGSAASRAMERADDETLIGFARFVGTAMDAAATDSDCAALGASASLIEAEALLNQEDARADDLAVSLLGRALKTHQPVRHNAETWTESMKVALTSTKHPCAQMRGVYAHALRLPQRDGAALIRALVGRPAQHAPLALVVVDAAH